MGGHVLGSAAERPGDKPGDGTVGKALGILDEVAQFGRPVRFGEMLAQSPYPKATLYRFLQTLTNQRMLTYEPERQTYALGIRLVRLAHAAWQTSSLAPIARPHLDRLSKAIGETVHLAQLDAAQVLYVDKRNAHEPIPMYSQAGKVGPAYCTGVGKAMIAFLPQADLAPILAQQSYHQFTHNTLGSEAALCTELARIRSRGYAFDREEHEPGIICVAVPILTENGRIMGALSVTSSTERTSLDALERHVPVIKRTAKSIAEEAQSWRFPDADNTQEIGRG
ncbi:IclR family transcriptional regulator [Rhodophyticola sp. CCM32]|uniref:IclR family transcriptional regulator n=1 Tax=Rhodophyticola sp. CCM32 TaxID=2916397 RepID=UPI00107F6CE8|nr:IclR family transcriptional regulator [Rhodophyticola sp. CCM32]QBY01583.1 IclR family transcriptional regulator [Rhodophyticola sp. CCM32]